MIGNSVCLGVQIYYQSSIGSCGIDRTENGQFQCNYLCVRVFKNFILFFHSSGVYTFIFNKIFMKNTRQLTIVKYYYYYYFPRFCVCLVPILQLFHSFYYVNISVHDTQYDLYFFIFLTTLNFQERTVTGYREPRTEITRIGIDYFF